jgi:hypothetical protein
MRISVLVALVQLALAAGFLTGCGDGGGVNSTPAPSRSMFPLTASGSFQTITGTLAYAGTVYNPAALAGGNAVANRIDTAGRGPAVTFGFDGASGTYTVTGASASANFTAANAVAATGYEAAFSKQAGTVTDTLALYGNAPAVAPSSAVPMPLTYTSFGYWSHADSSTVQTQNTYFVYGQPTGVNAMPVTGTASYQTTVSASMLEYNAAAAAFLKLGGTATFTADFGASSVSTALSLQYGTGNSAGTYAGTGAIKGDQFSGSLTSTNSQFTGGGFNGGFFGPAAKEMGYTFRITLHNPDPSAGAAILNADMAISGVVVGARK